MSLHITSQLYSPQDQHSVVIQGKTLTCDQHGPIEYSGGDAWLAAHCHYYGNPQKLHRPSQTLIDQILRLNPTLTEADLIN